MTQILKAAVAITVAAAALALAKSAPGIPPSGQPYAAGDGAVASRSFDFGASVSKTTGKVSGKAIIRWARRPRGMVELKVTCLQINRSRAIVGGTVVRRSGNRVARRFRSASFFVIDGRPADAPDGITPLRLSRQRSASCRLLLAGRPAEIRSGDIVVDDDGV
jgi:hypothetical protein